ncbi:DUF3265 domain-containing protein [Vibrio parahaemolyticus]|nr:DUF3265 domain-containing protein [Vibrio parahaemolyticus]
MAFLLCGWFSVEVPCSNLVIACFTPALLRNSMELNQEVTI